MKPLYRVSFATFLWWVFSLTSHAQDRPCPPCDNMERGTEKTCSDCETTNQYPTCGASNFNPYTGNVNRDVLDLEVWGNVGEAPLRLARYGNSRSVVSPWQLSFHYLLFDGGTNGSGKPQLELHYPEGNRDVFAQYGPYKGGQLWLPIAGVGERIFQYGNNFFLQMPNGFRYRFEKMVVNSITEYRLVDFKDQYQNLYKITYDDAARRKRITEPAGRYIELQFTNRSFNWDPVSARTSDGRMVQYVYDTLDDGVRKHIRLRSVLYGDGTKATYDYTQQVAGLPFVLSHANDPRVMGMATNIRYSYVNFASGIAGLIHQEINGKTGQVMAALDGNTADRKVKYTNGRIQVFHMPDSQMSNINRYTDGLLATWHYTYFDQGLGFLKSVKDPLGRVTTYDSVTVYGNPLRITHPDGSREQWFRDTLDLVVRYIDQLGRTTTYTRDSRHRPIRIDFPDGRYETFTYNGFSQVMEHQQKNGCIERFIYDSRGLKTKFTDCDGKTTEYSYDAADRLASVKDARGNITRYQYDERGLLTRIIHPDNSTQQYKYDDFGNRDTVINELGNIWATTYDEFRRPTTMTDPLNRTTTYSYDLPGGICGCAHDKANPTKITLPSGRMTTMTYDVEWQLIRKTEGAGTADAATTEYRYDLVGNQIKTIDPAGQPWTTTYDNMNRKKTASDPLTNTTVWTYDVAGNVLSEKRPNGDLTTYVYDRMDRVIKQTDPKGQVTQWVYDHNGNVMRLIDPKGNSYTFGYDVLDRKTYMTYSGLAIERYTYDEVGNLKTYTNRNKNVRTYSYDNRNRDTLADWNDATPDVRTTYDAAGRVLTKSSSVSALSYSYNAANELKSETQNIAGSAGPKTVRYDYNQDGLGSAMTYPSGIVLTYDYTGRNQLKAISENTGPSTPVVSYTYELTDERKTKLLQNGTSAVYGYDDAHRLLSIDHQKRAASFAKFNYGYDEANRRTYVQYDNAKGDVYSYDPVDQVTGVKYDVTNPAGVPGTSARNVTYDYDPVGNRTATTDNAVPTAFSTNSLNQYTVVGAKPLTHSANGNLQTFDGWTYTYDAQNRLIKSQKAATIVEFHYDPANRCVKRMMNATATYLHYDQWNLIEERSAADGLLQQYVHGAMIDEILKKASPVNTVYYHQDGLGSVVRLTDTGGNVVEQYSYDVFGALTVKNGSGTVVPGSAFQNRLLFTGREYIIETNLYDYRNRMYHAAIGRFMQTDPILLDAEDVNLYRYVRNNPTNYVDPLGLNEAAANCQDQCDKVAGLCPLVVRERMRQICYTCCNCITDKAGERRCVAALVIACRKKK